MKNSSSSNESMVAPAVDPSTLRASPAGTKRYAQERGARLDDEFYRVTTFDLVVSSLGIGTYLGDATDEHDTAYAAAVLRAIDSGVNVIDTAINYRAQRSELVVGNAIQQAITGGIATRDALVVCSKGGYIPLDHNPPATRDAYRAYIEREFIATEILTQDEIIAGGHSLAPRFLRYCIAKSRQNLGLRTIDVYYLHNPEQQASAVTEAELRQRIRAGFAVLEESASRGEIGVYGCATWDGLRVPPDSPRHLSLEALVSIAREIAGDANRFKVVQMPISMALPEAVRMPTQRLGGRMLSAVEAASELGLTVIASAPLMQGTLTSGLPSAAADLFPRARTDAQRALAFVGSLPGVSTALVGMKSVEHVDSNLEYSRK